MADNLKTKVDQLGALKAHIAELTAQEKKLKDELIEKLGKQATYEGDFYRVAISTYDRASLDMDAVRAKLSPQFIKAHTNHTECTNVKVSARVRDAVNVVEQLARKKA